MDLLTKDQYKKIAQTVRYCTEALIDGKMVKSLSGRTFPTENPATGEKLTDITACDAADVDLAVSAARQAFNDQRWAGLAPADRKKSSLK